MEVSGATIRQLTADKQGLEAKVKMLETKLEANNDQARQGRG